jgi:hypothetical protein
MSNNTNVPNPPSEVPMIPFARYFETEKTVSRPWVTILCESCQQIRLTEMSLLQLMYMRHRVCYKCQDKEKHKKMRQDFIRHQEKQEAKMYIQTKTKPAPQLQAPHPPETTPRPRKIWTLAEMSRALEKK